MPHGASLLETKPAQGSGFQVKGYDTSWRITLEGEVDLIQQRHRRRFFERHAGAGARPAAVARRCEQRGRHRRQRVLLPYRHELDGAVHCELIDAFELFEYPPRVIRLAATLQLPRDAVQIQPAPPCVHPSCLWGLIGRVRDPAIASPGPRSIYPRCPTIIRTHLVPNSRPQSGPTKLQAVKPCWLP